MPPSLVLAVLLYGGLRVMILLTNFDAVALHGYELYPMGCMAKDILDGGGFPLQYYCETHTGGFLITGIAAVPFYYLFGSTYFALKMVPFLFGLAVLVLLHFFLRAHFSVRAAALGSILFALAPTTLTKHSVIAMGNHFEIILFVMLLFFFHYRFLFGGGRRVWWLLSAFLAGFALFHNFSALIVIGLCGLVHLRIRGWRNTVKDFLLGVPFFLLGALPLIIINLWTEGGAAVFLEAKYAKESASFLPRFAGRLWEFTVYHLPVASCFEGLWGVPGRVADYTWLLVFLAAALCVLMFRDENRLRIKALPFVLYLPLLAAAYAAGNFRLGGFGPPHTVLGYRYFQTHYFISVLLIAVCASSLSLSPKRGVFRRVGILLAVLGLLAGLFNFSLLRSGKESGCLLGQAYEGHYYPKMSRALAHERYKNRPEAIEHALKDFRAVYRCRTYSGVGFLRGLIRVRPRRGFAVGKLRMDNLDIPALLADVPENHRVDASRGLGSYLREVVKQNVVYGDKKELAQEILDRLGRHAGPEGLYVLEGLMLNHEFLLSMKVLIFLADNEKIIKLMPKTCRRPLRHGQGLICGRLLRRAVPEEEEIIRKLTLIVPKKERADFYFGLGWGAADGGDDPALPPAFEKMVPEAMRKNAYMGFGAGLRHLFGPTESVNVLKSMEESMPESSVESIREGMDWSSYPAY